MLIPKIHDLVPHKGEMNLIDEIQTITENQLQATADLSKPNIFFSNSGLLPCFVGIEYLIQGFSALAGYKRYLEGLKPNIGLLLGTKRCEVHFPLFPLDSVLQICVNEVFAEEPIGVMDGQITVNDIVFVEGRFKAYQPKNIQNLENILMGRH